MQCQRRFAKPITAIVILILLSVLAVVSLGEGLKLLVILRDGVKLRKRDGSTITFDLPWKSVLDAIPKTNTELKAVAPPIGDLFGDVTAVASAIISGGSNIASDVASQGADLASPAPGSSALSTVAPDLGHAAMMSSVLQQVHNAIADATGILESVVNAATSMVGSLLAEATNPSNIGALAVAKTSSSAAIPTLTMSEPQEFLPQTALCKTCNGSFPSSTSMITSSPMLNSSQMLPAAPTGSSGPSMTAFTPSCPPLVASVASTCTVTETWHSTHYAETATFYGFITVTCTETISVCPSSSPSLLYANTIIPSSSLVPCANGAFAKPSEDCPTMTNVSNTTSTAPISPFAPSNPCPNTGYTCSECPDGYFCPPQQIPAQSCPCGYGWACGHCRGGWYCIPGPTSGGTSSSSGSAVAMMASMLSPVSRVPTGGLNSGLVSMSGFTANLPMISFAAPSPTSPTGSGSVVCSDGSVVAFAKDCLNGVSGVSSLLALASPVSSSNTLVAPLINTVMADVGSALSNINGLSGSLLGTVMADFSSALGAVNAALGNMQPTLTPQAGNTAGNLPSTVAVGGIVPTVTTPVGNLASGVVPTVAAFAQGATANANNPGGLVPTAVAAANNLAINAQGALANAIPQVNDVAATTLVNGVPAVNNPVAQLVGGIGGLKGKRAWWRGGGDGGV